MQSPHGYRFVQRALLYNARRQGADAVILRKLDFDLRRNYNYVPPRWDSIPQTSVFYQSVKDCNGKWITVPQTYTTYVPIFRPARTIVNDVQWTSVEADMIVHRRKPPWSPSLPNSTHATRYLPPQTSANR